MTFGGPIQNEADIPIMIIFRRKSSKRNHGRFSYSEGLTRMTRGSPYASTISVASWYDGMAASPPL